MRLTVSMNLRRMKNFAFRLVLRTAKCWGVALCAASLCAAHSSEKNFNSISYNDVPDYGGETYLSPDFIEEENGIVYFSCRTSGELRAVRISEGKGEAKTLFISKLAPHPSGFAIGEQFIYATSANKSGKIFKIEKSSGKVLSSAKVGHMARAPILSPDGKFLYFANQFENLIRVFNAKTFEGISRAQAVREPYSLAITPDGKTLFVLNHLPESKGGLYEENIASSVSIFDAPSLANHKILQLPNGSINAKEITISPDGKFAYCTHNIARFNVPTTQVERGWVNTNAVTIIDVCQKKILASFLLDDIELGAANPYGIKVSPDGEKLFVCHSGSHEISIIDLKPLHEKIAAKFEKAKLAAKDERSKTSCEIDALEDSVREEICNDMSFLHGLRKRVETKGLGPRHLDFFKDGIVIANYYSDFLEIISLKDLQSKKIDVGGNENMNQVRRGDLYFHDANLCFQKWLSCSTCHSETRSDALNWDLVNDGIGNPKQSKSLLFAHFTPPSMITGIRKDAYIAVRKGIRHIQFSSRPEEDAKAVDSYMMSLRPVPSPHLAKNGSLTENQEWGKTLFEIAECNYCHSGEYFTDMKMHDAGSGLNEYENKTFDTPSLRESWRTAPYLYDGRARTIFEMLKIHNKDDKHGKTSELTDEELRALEDYVLTL